jgi:hypothetical protein
VDEDDVPVRVIRESCTVDVSHAGFVHLVHVRVKDTGVDIGGPLWFEWQSLPWVVQTLRSLLTIYAFPRTAADIGQDSLKVFESGDEQAPITNVMNRRPDGAPHGGVYAVMMGRTVAERLLDDLAALPPEPV